MRDYFTRLSGEDKFIKEASFFAQVIGANSYLAQTSAESRLMAFQSLADSGLTLNPTMKLAYLVPRKGKCVLEPSYMGLVKLLTDTGSVRHIEARPIYAGDECEVDMASDKKVLRHVPYALRGVPPGEIRAFYSLATLADGAKHVEFMSKAEVDAIAQRSESVKSKGTTQGTVWGTDYVEMGRKTVIKRHCKHLPKSDRFELIAKAIEIDNHDFDLDGEKRGYRPQLATAAETAERKLTDDLHGECERLKDQVREAFKIYKGEDKNTIKMEIARFAESGVLDPGFYETMLKRLRP